MRTSSFLFAIWVLALVACSRRPQGAPASFYYLKREAKAAAAAFVAQQNEKYRDPANSPLPADKVAGFQGHSYYPFAAEYCIKARYVPTPNQPPFEMMTSTGKTTTYEKVGEAHFSLHGKPVMLTLYQSHYFRDKEGYVGLLFLPFKDTTNDITTYGAGRYIYVKDYSDSEILIDFNQSFNPYCAYNEKFSCPVVPKENRLTIPIEAGVKYVPEKQ